jgi:hypothetical protein
VAVQEETRDQMIQRVASLGYEVSEAQLARWHRAGLLPRPQQRPLGRGRGTETNYPPGASVQVVAICQIKHEERRLGRIAFRLWWEGFAVDLEVIRNQLSSMMEPLENEIRNAGAGGEGKLRGAIGRSLGPERIKAIIAMAGQAASAEGEPPTTAPWETLESWPPTLDEIATLLGHATATQMAGTPVASLIAQASDDDLIRARDRTRSMTTLLRNAAAPMAWLYGKSGSVFKMVDQMMESMTPQDYMGMVAMMVAYTPVMRPEVLAVLDTGTQPPLAQELRQILAIREQVPGAAQILTPMAIRACLRDKEAARRYRPQIDHFAAEHREEIDSVLAAMQSQPDEPDGAPTGQAAPGPLGGLA